MARPISKKYIDFLDTWFDCVESWSGLVTLLVNTFNITADYADRVVERYIEEV